MGEVAKVVVVVCKWADWQAQHRQTQDERRKT